MTLKELKAELKNVQDQIGRLREKEDMLEASITEVKTGLKIGMNVIRNEDAERKYKIIGFNEFVPIGKLIKKNGSLSKVSYWLWGEINIIQENQNER